MQPTTLLAQLFLNHWGPLVQYVAKSYPRRCRGHAEDAVSEAFTIALRQPDPFEGDQASAERRMLGLLRVVAWRQSRREACRGWGARETPTDDLGSAGMHLASQEFVTDVHLHIDAWALAAAEHVLPSSAERLAEAVLDRLLSGDTDGEVATRHGLRREYVNNARRRVELAAKSAA